MLYQYRLDVIGFSENILGVALHDGQKRILQASFPVGVEPLDWPFKFIHISTGNRFGKSVILAVLHLWFGTYKHRLPFAFGSDDWFDSPYAIINLCPLNEIAYVVREKVGLILMGKSLEQLKNVNGRGKVDPAAVALWKMPSAGERDRSGNPFLQMIPDTEYKGYVSKHNVHLEYRTADDHGKAVQGRTKYLITFDEAGRHKDPLGLLGSDIAPRTIDSRGLVVTATTPHLETSSNYEEMWERGNPSNPDRGKYTISFNGSMTENPHVTQQMREESLEDQPPYLWPQVIDGKFIQSEDAFFSADTINWAAQNIPNRRRRTRGHTYIIGWDLAIAKAGDRSIGVVVDISTVPCRVVEMLELKKGTKHPQIIVEMDKMLSFYHNEKDGCIARMVYDATGMGGQMFKTEVAVLYPRPKGYNFAGLLSKKLNLLKSVSILLSKKQLIYPKECTRLRYELKNYKRGDTKLETDTVMALALAVHIVERSARGGQVGSKIIFGDLSA